MTRHVHEKFSDHNKIMRQPFEWLRLSSAQSLVSSCAQTGQVLPAKTVNFI